MKKKAWLALIISLILAVAPLQVYGSDTAGEEDALSSESSMDQYADDGSYDASEALPEEGSGEDQQSIEDEALSDIISGDDAGAEVNSEDKEAADPAVSSSDETKDQTKEALSDSENNEQTEAEASSEEEASKEPEKIKDVDKSDASEKAAEKEDKASDEQELKAQASESSSGWTSADFVYADYEKELYGCDYTREFTISGKAVAGFSESGLEKLQTNKELVLPSRDTEGNVLVGVAENAFYEKGLTSVTFPTGMMIPYDDTVTHRITKRGNYVIAESAFAKNNLTEVYLPSGVIAVLPNAFMNNQIRNVTIPRTIWWIETQSFAKNQITNVSFPETTDFQFEMHGMAFADNQIRSVRIPDYTEVINKYTFVLNPGMEECDPKAGEKECGLGGVVYMYTDNLNLKYKDRIHHLERPTASQKAWHQKLIVVGADDEVDETNWTLNDFTVEGTTITGLSESGIAKRAVNKDLFIPNYNRNGEPITAIADSSNTSGGLFATADEKFNSVRFPSWLKKIGRNAFAEAGLKDVVFPAELEEIGMSAFRANALTSVILPDTLTVMGGGAFASNPGIERISLSKGLTEIPDGAFGCSDAKNWMAGLTELDIPSTVTKIGANAFAGNNIHEIVIPDSVTEIGRFAFSTKNLLTDECTLVLPEGLKTIGADAFRNKIIREVSLPQSVEALGTNTFRKEYMDDREPVVTKVYIKDYGQYTDKTNFPDSKFHTIIYTGADKWVAEDFTYGTYELTESDLVQMGNDTSDRLTGEIYVVTGLTDSGKAKLEKNTDIVIPDADSSGKKVQGVGKYAFNPTYDGFGVKITSVTLPQTQKVPNNNWDASVTERGDFFIGYGAFANNELRSVSIPEGVLYIGAQAFKNNKLARVALPESLMVISSEAFNGNAMGTSNCITSVEFPEKTDFPIFIGNMAFGFNQIQSVQLPDKTAVVHKWAFIANPGKEDVTAEGATAAEKRGGVVYMYINDEEPSDSIAHTENPDPSSKSNVQKLISEAIPEEEAGWKATDFTYSDDGAVITGLTATGQKKLVNDPNIVLPDESPAGVTITEIGPGVINNKGTFDYIDDNGVHHVPITVKFPSELKKIGNYAFAALLDTATGEQKGLQDLIIPDTVEEIGTMAFRYIPVTSVKIPDSVTKIGAGAFVSAEIAKIHITSAEISSNLTEIPANLFSAQMLEEVVIPDGVTTIGNYAFNGSPITELNIPGTVTSIGNCAFQNHQLSSLEIPAGVEKIGNYAFKSFTESRERTLAELKLNEGLVSIGKEAFLGSILKAVDLPQSVTNLDKDAFKDNKSGESVNGGKALLRVINEDQAAGTGDYSKVVTEGSGHVIRYEDKMYGSFWNEFDFTYSNDGSAITGWSESGQKKRLLNHDVVLPDRSPSGTEITEIADEAFMIPESEVSINKYEAVSENGIQTVVFPAGLKKIGDRAFEYNNLKALSFGGTPSISSIGVSAFHGNHIPAVHLPDTVDDLGTGAFSMNEITDIELSKNVTVIPQGAFSMNIRLEQITIPDTVTQIGEMAFAGARLTSLTIPASVEKIDRKAFHLHRLKELTIPGTVKEIGESAFEGTFKGTTLKTLILEEGIEKIGARAFKEGLLETVALPDSLKELGDEPFENNTGKAGDGIVVLTTTNPDHMKFDNAKYHTIRYYAEDISYAVTENTRNGQWTLGSAGTYDFTVSRNLYNEEAFDHFTGIAVDGKTLTGKDYSAASGSVKVSLRNNFMNALSAGRHTVEIMFDDGSAALALTVSERASGSGGASGGNASSGSVSYGGRTSGTAGTSLRSAGTRTVSSVSGASRTSSSVRRAASTGDNAGSALWAVILCLGCAGLASAVLLKRRRR